MARRKNIDESRNIFQDISADSDLSLRIETILEQTGLSPLNLFQKWVLQEESLIGLMRCGKVQAAKQTEIPDVQVEEEVEKLDPDSPDYREKIVERVKKLKKEGKTLVKIAELFNEEKLPTVSGKGQWYSSSITWLLSVTV
jgi:hypothetical protein